MTAIVDLLRWSTAGMERTDSPLRPLALVALQREARRYGLAGGTVAEIQRQALAAAEKELQRMATVVETVAGDDLRDPKFEAELRELRLATRVVRKPLTVSLTPSNLNP
jgi:hypothetical protein